MDWKKSENWVLKMYLKYDYIFILYVYIYQIGERYFKYAFSTISYILSALLIQYCNKRSYLEKF